MRVERLDGLQNTRADGHLGARDRRAPPSVPPAPPPVVVPTTTAAADPCAVNLAAPEIAKAVSELPRDPRSNQAWNPEPLAGNYNECAQLSAVIVKANTNAENPNTRAVMFHLGKFIPTGVPDTYGFNGIDDSATTGDTVALRYSGGVSGPRQRGEVPVERQRRRADRQHAARLLPRECGVVRHAWLCVQRASSPHSAAMLRDRATICARRLGS